MIEPDKEFKTQALLTSNNLGSLDLSDRVIFNLFTLQNDKNV